MSIFKFHDKKSCRQVRIASLKSNDTRQANANALLQYRIKQARLVGSRNEWELPEYDITESA